MVSLTAAAGGLSTLPLGPNASPTHMFFVSLAVAYLSSVVMLISSPALMGRSSSLTVLPVLISGPFCKTQVCSVSCRADCDRSTYGIEGNGQRPASLRPRCLTRVVDNRFVVLTQWSQLLAQRN